MWLIIHYFCFACLSKHHYLDDKMRIKAVRYFKDTSGWVPNYVEGAIAGI
jgi:cupin superfamily acireductone dioxygenase involved in methionine salvage